MTENNFTKKKKNMNNVMRQIHYQIVLPVLELQVAYLDRLKYIIRLYYECKT